MLTKDIELLKRCQEKDLILQGDDKEIGSFLQLAHDGYLYKTEKVIAPTIEEQNRDEALEITPKRRYEYIFAPTKKCIEFLETNAQKEKSNNNEEASLEVSKTGNALAVENIKVAKQTRLVSIIAAIIGGLALLVATAAFVFQLLSCNPAH